MDDISKKIKAAHDNLTMRKDQRVFEEKSTVICSKIFDLLLTDETSAREALRNLEVSDQEIQNIIYK